MKRVLIGLCLTFSACGGSKPSNPNDPTPPIAQPQANRAPTITQAAVAPSFGIADLQVFTVTASASDPDGDALTYTWELNGTTATGVSQSFRVGSPGGSSTVRLTVTDGRGGTVSSEVTFTAGSLAGMWTGTVAGFAFRMAANQSSSGAATATWNFPETPFSGDLDPAVVNRVDGNGNVTLRCKVRQGSFDDFSITGQLQSDGRTFRGTVTSSGFSGEAVLLTR